MAKKQSSLLQAFTDACNYPGTLDEQAVERALGEYIQALGVERRIVRLPTGWHIATEPSLLRYVGRVIDDFAARLKKRGIDVRDALDARAARDARDALDALDARDALDALAARAALDALAARAALDARAARDALDARAALAARAARDARAALDARAARDARDALDARAALDALDARDARDALAARDARDARDALAARDARDALDARDARDALAARDARDARDALAARDALDALAARDARAARAQRTPAERGQALQRFTEWCIQRGGWGWWWRFDLSLLASTHIGAVQLGNVDVQRWAKPTYDAFLAGAWCLHWTDDTLYWVAKPHVHVEEVPRGGRRLHSETTAALESDVERLYFWHGVLVPAFVVVRPDWITTKHIADEENAEVRRIMMERYGYERYVTDIGAKREQADDYGELYRVKRPGDSDLVMVRLVNSTAEPDGSFKRYMLRVPPTVTSAREAVAWTFGIERPEHYAPTVQT